MIGIHPKTLEPDLAITEIGDLRDADRHPGKFGYYEPATGISDPLRPRAGYEIPVSRPGVPAKGQDQIAIGSSGIAQS
jgi:hypothetical protein